jgi:ABC-type lipoprotein release transport system permease subunit
MLYEVTALHLPTLLGVSVILLTVAALASWVPARRAARTDLLGALRGE